MRVVHQPQVVLIAQAAGDADPITGGAACCQQLLSFMPPPARPPLYILSTPDC
jgi:hypothetical protein